jgi:nucleoside-diphosphate-sugar epimerase
MRVVIIGGTGHVGTYLVPRLVHLGHTVVCVSRQQREPYTPHAAWRWVERISIDREAEEQAGTFGTRITGLRPDVVIDMICFTPDSAGQLVEALRGRVQQLLHCGTIWIYGPSIQVPATEDQPRRPFGEYGIQKAATEALLLDEARRRNFPVSILHPGHIVGKGWFPLNPQGNFNPDVFSAIARGRELSLPNLGLETVHHVHADDVAQAFVRALSSWNQAVGECFHVVSGGALTLRGYAESMYRHFGQEPRLSFLPWDEWKKTVQEKDAEATWDHIAHSPNASIGKARRLLGYEPRYSSLEAVQESVDWLVAHSLLD